MASSTSAAAIQSALALLPAVPQRAPAVLSVRGRRRGAAAVVAASMGDLRPAIDEYPEGVLSGEWPDNFSLLSYADLRVYLESQIVTKDKVSVASLHSFLHVLALGVVGSDDFHSWPRVAIGFVELHMSPTAKLGDVMSCPVQVAVVGQKLAEIDAFFANQSGLPVLDDEGRCIGVVSKKDKAKASNGLDSTVGEVMSSPAITLTPERTILEAAALMLKNKVHRIPVVNEQQQVIGIISRTDVFQALEANKA